MGCDNDCIHDGRDCKIRLGSIRRLCQEWLVTWNSLCCCWWCTGCPNRDNLGQQLDHGFPWNDDTCVIEYWPGMDLCNWPIISLPVDLLVLLMLVLTEVLFRWGALHKLVLAPITIGLRKAAFMMGLMPWAVELYSRPIAIADSLRTRPGITMW